MYFLGVKIDKVSKEQARLKVRDFLALSGQFKIFTPNPEMVVKAQKDKYFREVLNKGDLNICDGFGLWLALVLSSRPTERLSALGGEGSIKVERIPGTDFMLEICQIAAEKNKSVFFLGSESNEIAEKTAKELQTKFPNLKIAGFDHGPSLTDCHSSPDVTSGEESLKVISKVNQSGAEILFVAFGMGKQEKWITENLSKMPNIKIAMGVGGAFDYISGAIPRAPRFLRKIGLEWMYRVIRQPWRIWRIFNATIKFLFIYFYDTFHF